MRTVVSNTTPLSTYLRAGREELLRALFGVVLIPQGVADELDRGKRWFGEWRERVPWVQVRSIQPSPLLDLLSSELDRGESEAISLAVECKADILLMDEAAGRQKSRELKLEILGSKRTCSTSVAELPPPWNFNELLAPSREEKGFLPSPKLSS